MRRGLPLLLAALLLSPLARAGEEDLKRARAIEAQVQDLVLKVRPAVVSILASGPVSGAAGFRQGTGSGVIISADGLVLTNHHVAGWAREIQVTLPGRKVVPARIVGSDPGGDLLLLGLEGDGPWPSVELGDSDDLAPGAWVFAMGNPRGVAEDGRAIVTWGTVTAMHRLGGSPRGRHQFYGDALQIDAEINPGNSGGPLFGLAGRLVGINGRIATRIRLPRTPGTGLEAERPPEGGSVAVNAGVGFAIPVNQIRRFLPALRKGGIVHHGYLGVRTVVPANGRGLSISFVVPGSPAAAAGLQNGDLLLALDGRPVVSRDRLTNLVSSRPEGQRVALRIRRDDREMILVVTLGPRPEESE